MPYIHLINILARFLVSLLFPYNTSTVHHSICSLFVCSDQLVSCKVFHRGVNIGLEYNRSFSVKCVCLLVMICNTPYMNRSAWLYCDNREPRSQTALLAFYLNPFNRTATFWKCYLMIMYPLQGMDRP